MFVQLTDRQWQRLSEVLPHRYGDQDKILEHRRQFIALVLWVFKSGAQWTDLPDTCGPWKSHQTQFIRWAKAGVWERMRHALEREEDAETPPWLIAALAQAGTGRKGRQRQAV